MAQTVLITLTLAGTDTGPFDLYSDVDGYVSAFETGVPKASLVGGYVSVLVPDGATVIRVKSTGVCSNYIDLAISGTTTTTTTSSSTTTTTSSSTSTTTSTTTSGSPVMYTLAYSDVSGATACGNYPTIDTNAYYAAPGSPLTPTTGVIIYTDGALTTPAPNGFYSNGVNYWNTGAGSGNLQNETPC
jgi:hypothetical protein